MKLRSEMKIRAPTLAVLLPALLATLLAALPGSATEPGAPEAASPQEPPPDVAVEVNGLSCPFCAYGIEKKFVERPEVESVVVALEENEVHLWLRSGQELSDEQVRRTVEEAGFTPGAIRRPERSGARGP